MQAASPASEGNRPGIEHQTGIGSRAKRNGAFHNPLSIITADGTSKTKTNQTHIRL